MQKENRVGKYYNKVILSENTNSVQDRELTYFAKDNF
jgi:hypothetical protein